MALSKASGPSRIAARDLPAVGHLAQRRRVDGRGNLRRHGFDRRQDRDPRRAEADRGEQIDRVLDDVALGIEVGKDVDRGIGDEQRFGIGRHVHDEDVADAPRGAQAGLREATCAHQLVGVQAALHQELALGLADQLDALAAAASLCGRRRSRSGRYRGRAARATAAILAAGPTRIGTMMPASAASIGPRSEVSSQGCTTTVVAGGSLLGPGDEPIVLGARRRGERAERRDGSDFVLVSRHDRLSACAVRACPQVRLRAQERLGAGASTRP